MKPTTRYAARAAATRERTHEGAPASNISDKQRLRRSVLACLLFEREFYEDGESVADRIQTLAAKIDPVFVSDLAIEARLRHNLRHVPLLLARSLAQRLATDKTLAPIVEATLSNILRRADEPGEFLALLWEKGQTPIPHAVRRGIGRAMQNFDEYQLAKYKGGAIPLKGVLKLTHPKAHSPEQSALWKHVLTDELATPVTWETELSAGKDKKETFERLIAERKLGDLALLRNLRNMLQAGVPKETVAGSMAGRKWSKVLPFRFLAAARAVPQWEDIVDQAMLSIAPEAKLDGHTVIIVDVSGSMEEKLSAKSDLTRMDAACGIAIAAREMCSDCAIYTFSQGVAVIASRRGMALRDAIVGSQSHSSTYLGAALQKVGEFEDHGSRVIIVTDEQTHDSPQFWGKTRYLINVASARNGIGYGGITHIDGFSERVLEYIAEVEADMIALSEGAVDGLA